MNAKYRKLQEIFRSMGKAAVAFSGGVDSTLLLAAAVKALGSEHVMAVTVTAPWVPKREQREAEEFCRELGVRHVLLEAFAEEIPGFRENPADRCYICKRAIFSKILREAEPGGYLVAEGSNVDDTGDYRPGMRAIRELGVRSPLMEAGLTKAEIRELSRLEGLPTWSKPSFACLASRIPYGDTITDRNLSMAEQGEDLLLSLGFSQFRVRIHGEIARIELLPQEFLKMMEPGIRLLVCERFREFGFRYVTMDLMGYRTGSLNEVLKGEESLS